MSIRNKNNKKLIRLSFLLRNQVIKEIGLLLLDCWLFLKLLIVGFCKLKLREEYKCCKFMSVKNGLENIDLDIRGFMERRFIRDLGSCYWERLVLDVFWFRMELRMELKNCLWVILLNGFYKNN